MIPWCNRDAKADHLIEVHRVFTLSIEHTLEVMSCCQCSAHTVWSVDEGPGRVGVRCEGVCLGSPLHDLHATFIKGATKHRSQISTDLPSSSCSTVLALVRVSPCPYRDV